MKIGFSFGRCIGDIVEDRVNIDDVLIIISGTYIEERGRIANVVDSYLHRPFYLLGLDRDKCLEVAYQLWDSGRIHEPRAKGAYPPVLQQDNIWADTVPTTLSQSSAVQEAWEAYRMLLNLANNVPTEVPHVPL